MGSGGSKKASPNASNNAGQSSKQADNSSLPPLKQSSTEQGKSDSNSTPKLPHNPTMDTSTSTTTGSSQKDTVPPKHENLTVTNSVPPKQDSVTLPPKQESKKGDNFTEEPEDQRKFDDFICSACVLVKGDSITKKITRNVTKLQLNRALPWNLYEILTKFTNLQEIDIANNNIGPHAFRSVCLAMCTNSTVTSLNLADNMADTDSAECIGRMLSQNTSLLYLNVSSNTLGKDYFSRCVGPALKQNSTLQTLRAQNIGSADMRMFLEGLKENRALTDIDLSNNTLTDRTALGKSFGDKLKDPDCQLKSVSLANCEMNPAGIDAFIQGFESSCSLEELNLSGNEFEALKRLGKLVVLSMKSSTMRNLTLDTVRITDKNISMTDVGVDLTEDFSPQLQILSLNDSSITDGFWSIIEEVYKGRQISLIDINIGSNSDLSPKCLDSIRNITSDTDGNSSIERINYSLNNQCSGLTEKLSVFPRLRYVNIRRCRMKDIQQMAALYTTGNLTTLVLDNLKLAGTDTLKGLMENATGSSLTTLSIGGCSLSASDIAPLCDAIKKGFQLQMLKLSANRLEDEGVTVLSQALIGCKTHPLAVLDLSSNTFTDVGAQSLIKIFTTKSHKSQLHSLNVTSNNIGLPGLMGLAAAVGGKSPLRTLYLQNQREGLKEDDITEIFKKLAAGLGFNMKKMEAGSSDMPNLPEGLLVNMSSLGGHPGKAGALLDSQRIITDYPDTRIPTMTFGHIQELCAWLKNSGSDVCVWSVEDWGLIIGSNRPTSDAPSWLQLEGNRSKAVYLSNLPGNTTQQKMDAMFEMEADCNLDEVCLMKDPVTRSINGTGWVLMADEESVQKAVDFFQAGEAKVFGQPIKISKLKVKVDDDVNSQVEAKAREDQEMRQMQRKQEAQEYRSLIQRSTEESWKRHAYRLAHPAYADGRIW